MLLLLKTEFFEIHSSKIALDSFILQTVVLCNRVKQILEEAHDFPSGGHFGNKILDKIRRRFYWATCKMDVENCRSYKICLVRRGRIKGVSPANL